jgi:hypothetical protein
LAAHEVEMISRHVATKPPARVLRGVRRVRAPASGALTDAGPRTAARRDASRGQR